MSHEPVPADEARRSLVALVVVWGCRVAWLLVAVVGGPAVGEAVRDHSSPATVTVLAWLGWAAGALALAVPSVASLTAARVIVPASPLVALATAAGGASGTTVVALAAPALVAAVLVLTAETGRAWVQASAYGDEQRFPLRPPLGYLGATVATWLVWVAAVLAAAVAWPAGRWTPAVTATVVAVLGALVLPRRWHQLSRRWLVTVPAGLVVHDPVVLAETLMVRRTQLADVTAGHVTDDATTDLTGPRPGVGLVVALREVVVVVLAPGRGERRGRAVEARRFVVAPSRPGAALAEAGRRRFAPR